MKPVSNEKLVQDMMRYSEAGFLKQAFIIEAIRVYSEQTLTITKEEWGENNFINLEAWQQCARECVDAISNGG
jgi:hypothetical protein